MSKKTNKQYTNKPVSADRREQRRNKNKRQGFYNSL